MFGVFGRGRKDAVPSGGTQPRLVLEEEPAVTYAIGDVHGCLAEFKDLEARIVADARDAGGEKLIVMLGDYVDRGPSSAGVIDHLLAPPPQGFRRVCLMGNHEAMMLGFLDEPSRVPEWLVNGGVETLLSYGVDLEALDRAERSPRRLKQALESSIPAEHREFMAGLPVMVQTPLHVFVHAGLRPGLPLSGQQDYDLIWIRDDYANAYDEFERIVVHGHTPRLAPLVTATRIAIDTGAFMTGRLTAVRLQAGKAPKILATGRALRDAVRNFF